MRKLIAAIILLITGSSFAQNFEVNPLGIVVNPRPQFTVDLQLNRPGTPTYQPGELISFTVSPTADAYIYLFNVRSDGQIVQILPNQVDQEGRNNFVRANETKAFPPRGAGYQFEVTTPYGLDKVIAVASRDPLDTSTLASFQSGEQFATSSLGESGFARALGIVVTPVPSGNWVTDTEHFYVGNPTPQPTTGTMAITSSPNGAAVYVDNNFAGYAPLNYTSVPGSYTVRFDMDGYNSATQSVTVNSNRTVNVHGSLTRRQQTGTVSFHSSPNRATVFLGGERLGTTPLNNHTLNAGTYEARFSLDGHNDAFVTFTVTADTRQTINASLQSRAGAIRITANVGGALVFLNGSQAGVIPSGSGVLTLENLASGEYEIAVLAPGYETEVEEVEVSGGRTTELRIRQSRF